MVAQGSALVWAAGVMALATWSYHSDVMGWRHGAGLAAVMVSGALAWVSWRASPRGVLAWSGSVWVWMTGGIQREGDVAVHLDLQTSLLLWFRAERGRGQWIWLSREAAPVNWHDLRRAVHSSKGEGVPTTSLSSHP